MHRNGTRQVKFKLVDKKGCLALLAQHFGLTDPGKKDKTDDESPEQQAAVFKAHLDELLDSVPSSPDGEDQCRTQ